MKKLLSTLSLIFPVSYALCQCYGPTSTGTYTSGKKPSTNSNYFVNHIFSSFSNTNLGDLNGNAFVITTVGLPTSNTIVTTAPGETLVTGSGFPSTTPAMQSISTNSVGTVVTHLFTSDLQAGTHVYMQDIDMQENWSIVFKDASGLVVNPSGFTPINVSTQNLPSTFTLSSTSLSFKSTSGGNRSEPLVGIIITSSSVRSIEFSLTTAAGSASQTEIFYSVSVMPSFTATASSNSIVCSGSTLKYFIVERSSDQNKWSEIGYVSAAGNSNRMINYAFTDSVPLSGVNYYRLKQVDIDSKYYLSSVRSVMTNSNWKFNIYPNPVTGGLLKLQSNTALSTIVISDVYGRVLLKKSGSDITDNDLVNISSYKAGLYFIQVINDKNKVMRTSFVKY